IRATPGRGSSQIRVSRSAAKDMGGSSDLPSSEVSAPRRGRRARLDHRPMAGEPFWRRKTLAQMTRAEWESLCDGCGLCCLVRFEEEDSGQVVPTRVHCKLFDAGACACTDYANRKKHVPDCVKLTPGNIDALPWMPKSCAYRRLHEGRDLAA